ncbi:phosphatidylinositol phosphatase PTPRQ [Uranotaenia lowii]|uniref:phosphatidylinositol phosphatase PTPRQ n=1 Tax=Uranotaenia lowii TaxID=190385 RepID=UPI0024784767|nr:phosphatidylinositol phosphatase PTPRQ [Uranotaenia lowii]XP_055592195.1 phosphatidylinositol phosphatase PTPRQ [Uranotaenia lowii]XP_055592196.1 phosphatidylinositol phosphatase PTPRQ [Uranotaenia lowii]
MMKIASRKWFYLVLTTLSLLGHRVSLAQEDNPSGETTTLSVNGKQQDVVTMDKVIETTTESLLENKTKTELCWSDSHPINITFETPRTIRWQYPSELVSCLDSFRIVQEIVSHDIVNETVLQIDSNDSEGEFLIDSLEPDLECAHRKISIRPVFKEQILQGETFESSFNPVELQDIQVDQSVPREVTISWKKADLYGGCLKKIEISYGEIILNLLPSSRKVIVKDLNPCETHQFNISAIDLEDRVGFVQEITATIQEEEIGEVTEVALVKGLDNETISIQWKRPLESMLCVNSFELQYKQLDSSFTNVSTPVIENEGMFQQQIEFDLCELATIFIKPVSMSGRPGKVTQFELQGPVEQLDFRRVSDTTSIKIDWIPAKGFGDCISHFLIQRDGLREHLMNTTSTEIEVSDLKLCKFYKFRVEAVYRDGGSYPSPVGLDVILDGPISKVQEVTERSESIEWKLPINGAGCVEQFQLTRTRLEDNVELTFAIVNVTAGGPLDRIFKHETHPVGKCAQEVNVRIVPYSWNKNVGEIFDQNIKPFTPGPVQNVKLDPLEPREVTLAWTEPILHPASVCSYKIMYHPEGVEPTIKIVPKNVTVVTIGFLEPCVQYNFTIVAVTLAGDEGFPVSFNYTIEEEKISVVQDLTLREESESIYVDWTPPKNAPYCVSKYRLTSWIELHENRTELDTNTTHAILPRVYACARYYVQIIPESISRKDGMNLIADYRTSNRVISRVHIDPITQTSFSATTLGLATKLSAEHNNLCSLLSVRFTCSPAPTQPGDDREVTDIPTVIGEFHISHRDSVFEGVLANLLPFSRYSCIAQILNTAGWSEESARNEFVTDEAAPEQPTNLSTTSRSHEIQITWREPTIKNGIILRYRINIQPSGPNYPTPSYCEAVSQTPRTIDIHNDPTDGKCEWDNQQMRCTVDELLPFSNYIVQVSAATKAGFGSYTEMVFETTEPDVPEPVHEFLKVSSSLPDAAKDEYSTKVLLAWKIPCRLNGKLLEFRGQFIDSKQGVEHILSWNKTILPGEEIVEEYSHLEDRLKPEVNYNVSIMVLVGNVADASAPKFVDFSTPAGIPPIIEHTTWGSIDVLTAPNPTQNAMINLSGDILKSDVGDIRYVALLVSQRYCTEEPKPKRNLSTEWPEERKWHQVYYLDCTIQYQTTPRMWHPVSGRQQPSGEEMVTYIVGNETCGANDTEFCNGPLKPATEYHLVVRIFTATGFSDSRVINFATDTLIQLNLIIALVCVILTGTFGVGFFILWRKNKALEAAQLAVRSPNDEPADIPLKNFSIKYDELVQSNREKILKEFHTIHYFSEELLGDTVTFFAAKENDKKNRYLGILPYDGNRVPLDFDHLLGDEDEEVNDYINASFIDGYKYQREYIATQGPKQETSFDFWRMILQYEVECIVMLTQCVENDKNKCYQYFPKFNKQVQFRDIYVRCTQELNMGFYQKRLMIISRGAIIRAVYHYHYLVWPDHGVPSSPTELLKFVKIVRAERKSLAVPMVVHCSAGVGRTGTFIALDIVLQRIQLEKKINIFDTVKQLRRQRIKMVQTVEQYAFLYQSCLEFTNRNSKKKPKPSETNGNTASTNASGSSTTNAFIGKRRRPMINIKFPKTVNSGLANVKSYAPDDIESQT